MEQLKLTSTEKPKAPMLAKLALATRVALAGVGVMAPTNAEAFGLFDEKEPAHPALVYTDEVEQVQTPEAIRKYQEVAAKHLLNPAWLKAMQTKTSSEAGGVLHAWIENPDEFELHKNNDGTVQAQGISTSSTASNMHFSIDAKGSINDINGIKIEEEVPDFATLASQFNKFTKNELEYISGTTSTVPPSLQEVGKLVREDLKNELVELLKIKARNSNNSPAAKAYFSSPEFAEIKSRQYAKIGPAPALLITVNTDGEIILMTQANDPVPFMVLGRFNNKGQVLSPNEPHLPL
ncbi:hypothetical protein IPJ72_00320 [Candidatus Peregrinibacteria bacterium]|nr:MAG: hypothetical protein IPJ72_00320 [Candidatus Peregrinibacteria bacterium]